MIHNKKRSQRQMFAVLAAFMITAVGFGSLLITRAGTDPISIEAEGSTVVQPPPPPPPPPPPTSDMNIYFGSTHNHTGCCNDHGEDSTTAGDIFNLSKQYGFDFNWVTEHSNPRSVGASIPNPTAFYNDVKSKALSTSSSTFLGLAGVESGSTHTNLLNVDDFFYADSASNNLGYLTNQSNAGKKVFGSFNHPGASGHGASSTSNINATSRETMAISGVQYGTTSSSRDGAGYSAFLVHLDRGWRVGPSCELDGHGKFRIASWGESRIDTCRTGVLAQSLTRDNINNAIGERRFYTARDTNMEVRYKANGQWMGSKIGKPSNVTFDIDVNDPSTSRAVDKIKKIDIITEGGAVVASKTFDAHSVSWDPSIPANGKKYFFIRIFNGEYSYQAAVAAPVWLE